MLNHVGRTTLNKAIKRLKRLKHLIKSGEGCLIDKIKGSSCRVEATNGNLFVSFERRLILCSEHLESIKAFPKTLI